MMSWLSAIPEDQLFLAAMTLGELQRGVEITREQDPSKAAEIESWVDRLSETRNVLAMDSAVFRAWARLVHRRSDAVLEDAMIAATAMVHGLTVATRNIRDFKPFGVAVFDPFAATLSS